MATIRAKEIIEVLGRMAVGVSFTGDAVGAIVAPRPGMAEGIGAGQPITGCVIGIALGMRKRVGFGQQIALGVIGKGRNATQGIAVNVGKLPLAS